MMKTTGIRTIIATPRSQNTSKKDIVFAWA